jgi:hypothetical protein
LVNVVSTTGVFGPGAAAGGATYMGSNPTQYSQMVADIPQEDIPPLEEDNIQEEEEPEEEDTDKEDSQEDDN